MNTKSMQNIKAALESPPDEFRPYPFWFWNGDITAEEIDLQLRDCLEHGVTTVLIHPRYGLAVPYMGEEYMRLVRHTAQECRRMGMKILLYDDYNWPSGTAAGRILREYPEYRMQFVKCTTFHTRGASVLHIPESPICVQGYEKTSGDVQSFQVNSDNSVSVPDGDWLIAAFQVVAPSVMLDSARGHAGVFPEAGYLDVMNPDAVARFIELTHQAYYNALPEFFGSVITGIFTDEPGIIYDFDFDYDFAGAMSRSFPWNRTLETVFAKSKGYSLCERLIDLVADTPHAAKTRVDYREVITSLYTESYHKQISDWCSNHGIDYTGHVLGEENSLHYQGDISAALKHFHAPGLDWTSTVCGLEWQGFNTAKTVSSLAHAQHRKFTVCEAFGATGWNLTLADMKKVTDHLYALGINRICMHSFCYTLKAARIYECPPSIFFHNPWWRYFKQYTDYAARLGAILSMGRHLCGVGVLVPVRSYWAENNLKSIDSGEDYSPGMRRMDDLCRVILDSGLDYDLVFDSFVEDAEVTDSGLAMGDDRFHTLIVPPVEFITAAVWEKLRQLKNMGGNVIIAGRPPYVAGEDSVAVHVGRDEVGRAFDGCIAEDAQAAVRLIQDATDTVDVTDESGCGGGFTILRRLMPDEGIVCFTRDHTGQRRGECTLSFPGEFNAVEIDIESGDLQPICTQSVGLRTEVKLQFDAYQSRLLLLQPGRDYVSHAVEKPVEKKTIELGPSWSFALEKENCLRIRDLISIPAAGGRDADIHFNITCKDNIGSVNLLMEHGTYGKVLVNGTDVSGAGRECRYFDADQVAFDIGRLLETGQNRFSVEYIPDEDDEFISPLMAYAGIHSIQPHIYITGSFGVDENLHLVACPSSVGYGPWSGQGLPDYAGSAVYSSIFHLPADLAGHSIKLACDTGGGCIEVAVNGHHCGTRLWNPYELDITDAAHPGANSVEITVTNTAANMLRPSSAEFASENEKAYLSFMHEQRCSIGLLMAKIIVH